MTRWALGFLCGCVACGSGGPSPAPGGHEPGPTATTTPSTTTSPQPGENILIVLIDDLGTDKVRAYHPELEDLAVQPTLDRLAAEGVRFDAAYAEPVCSPTRGTLLSGRYPHQTGLGEVIFEDQTFRLPMGEVLLPRALEASAVPYTTGAFGKWHLVSPFQDALDAIARGFDVYAGWPGNIMEQSYDEHLWVEDGVTTTSTVNLTAQTVDAAIAFMQSTPGPWLTYVGLHAVHLPLELPPDGEYVSPVDETDPISVHRAMIEGMDHQLGRLLDGIPAGAHPTVIVLGDNGTERGLVAPPFDPSRCKTTAAEGGVRVPMFVTGPHVTRPGSATSVLTGVIDVFPTVLELGRVDPDDVGGGLRPGQSFLPWVADPDLPGGHTYMLAEKFNNNGPPPMVNRRLALRDARWKLGTVDAVAGTLALFDLDQGLIDEGEPILEPAPGEQQEAWDRLQAALAQLDADTPYAPEP